MAHLQINGYDVPVAADQMSRTPVEVMGRFGRNYTGGIDRSRSSEKRAWSFTTRPLTESEAEFLEGLLMGRGFYFPFDTSLYDAQKGFGPNTGYACTLNATTPKVGTRSLSVLSGATGAVYATGFTGDWSVMGWQYRDAAWYHFGVTYDVDATTYTEYVGGAAGAIDDTWRQLISSGNLTLVGKAYNDNNSENVKYDDLVVVPYVLDSTVVAWHFARDTSGYSELPFLSATGDFLKSTTPISVACMVTEESYRQTKSESNRRVLRVDMQEA